MVNSNRGGEKGRERGRREIHMIIRIRNKYSTTQQEASRNNDEDDDSNHDLAVSTAGCAPVVTVGC